jgi:hypothetical protein
MAHWMPPGRRSGQPSLVRISGPICRFHYPIARGVRGEACPLATALSTTYGVGANARGAAKAVATQEHLGQDNQRDECDQRNQATPTARAIARRSSSRACACCPGRCRRGCVAIRRRRDAAARRHRLPRRLHLIVHMKSGSQVNHEAARFLSHNPLIAAAH